MYIIHIELLFDRPARVKSYNDSHELSSNASNHLDRISNNIDLKTENVKNLIDVYFL